ncbi:Arabinose 5-phosphate isomerase KdsD [Thalassocella blandensis]|nr:Arabinose 5-phosphate isomerase KdsD [Thalassocella blandensis]
MTAKEFLSAARRTIQMEIEALNALENRLDDSVNVAGQIIMQCTGRVVVIGVGKSGLIGRKIAATLSSTGTPSFFVHPGEASHGDFGMITRGDVVLAISNSGASSEIVTLLPLIKRLGTKLISFTGNPNSAIAEAAEVNLDISVATEACPLNLAPTSSTTVTLAMGDALAVALLEARGFTAEDFAFSHPGGSLGKKLLLRVGDVMHDGKEIPRVKAMTPLKEALAEMTAKGFGMTTVVNAQDQLIGIFTDGDLRRCVDRNLDINTLTVEKVMTASPRTVNKQVLAAEALNLMETHKITALVVENDNQAPVGVLHMHDLLRAGII